MYMPFLNLGAKFLTPTLDKLLQMKIISKRG